jgi:hypothetical protein
MARICAPGSTGPPISPGLIIRMPPRRDPEETARLIEGSAVIPASHLTPGAEG